MKNNKGFTLVELLAVVVILAIIVTIAVPSTMAISNKIKKNMYCTKLDFIENAAKLYGEDKRDELKAAKKEVTVEKLVNGKYLKKDQSSSPFIVDPRNKSNGLDNMNLIVYLKNDRVQVLFPDGDVCDKNSDINSIPEPSVDDDSSNFNISSNSNNVKVQNQGGQDIIIANGFTESTIKNALNVESGEINIDGNYVQVIYNGKVVSSYPIVGLKSYSMNNNVYTSGNNIHVKTGTNINNFKNSDICVNCRIEVYDANPYKITTDTTFNSGKYYVAKIKTTYNQNQVEIEDIYKISLS